MWESTLLTLVQEMALAAEQTTEKSPNPLRSMWPMLIAFMGIMYFFMIRPNQKRDKERREMLAALSKGDHVITQGGIHGTIVGVSEKSVVLRICDDPPVKMEFAIGAISTLNKADEED